MMRLLGLFFAALVIFSVLAASASALPLSSPAWLEQAILKSLLILVSAGAMLVDRRRSFSDYGFRVPVGARWLLVTGSGLLLGMIATTLIVVTPAAGMKEMFSSYGFLDIVIWIWFYSSISEEIFTRGWFQSLVGPAAGSARVTEAASALLFGSMHLSLITKGADAATVIVIVTATTILGLLAARFRSRTGSILPAIVTHVAFNVGGAIAGIGLTILSMLTGGAIPHP